MAYSTDIDEDLLKEIPKDILLGKDLPKPIDYVSRKIEKEKGNMIRSELDVYSTKWKEILARGERELI
jgi:hypothetical protein